MVKEIDRKIVLITIVVALLFSSLYTYTIPNAQASQPTVQQKGLSILNDAVGIDIASYNATVKEYSQNSYFGVIPQQNIQYTLQSDTSKLKLFSWTFQTAKSIS